MASVKDKKNSTTSKKTTSKKPLSKKSPTKQNQTKNKATKTKETKITKAKNNTNKNIKTNPRLAKIKAKAVEKKFSKASSANMQVNPKIKNTKFSLLNFTLTSVSLFVFILIFEYIWHGIILADMYYNTSYLWRSALEMPYYLKYTFITQIALAILLTIIFAQNHENKALGEGLRFGFFTGLFLAITQTAPYAYMPIPGELAFLWLVGSIIEGIGIGLVLACIYKQENA